MLLLCELIGTAALAIVFVPAFGWWPGLRQALLHAISAFNHAGFARFPDSLSQWANHPLINLVIPDLFIIGGNGFGVLANLYRTRGWRKLSLHTKQMLVTAVLIGGGIKVTTLIVLLLATIAFFKRQSSLHAFGRSLGNEEVMKVLALTMLSLLLVMFSAFVILLPHDGDFLDLLFEVTSAFGTVGLSRGGTGDLDGLGRAVIRLLMFIGRAGPLTLGFFLASQMPSRIRYPASRVFLG